jgi:hypothetical protein
MKAKISFKAILFGIILIPINDLWVVYMMEVKGGAFPTSMSLFSHAVFSLLIVFLLNLFLKRYIPRLALNRGEVLLTYSMVALGSCWLGIDNYPVLVSCATHPYWFATPENKYKELFFKYLPKWLIVPDKKALEGYFLGWSSFYTKEHILAWLKPILYWTLFFMIMVWIMMCMNIIFRKQWAENERLTFPIIQLPLAITDESLYLFKSKLMWIGFAIAAIIDIINNINANYPFFFHIAIRDYDLGQFITTPPWNAIGWTPLYFFPCIIGLGYLLPLDLAFSCWFFYWYWKMLKVMSVAFNLQVARPDMPYINDQSAGAYLGIAFFVLWVGRRYLYQVLKRIFTGRSEVSDEEEPLSYRAAFLGIILGYIALIVFLMEAGMRLITAFLFLLIFFLLSLAIARIRVELGSPVHDLHFAGPDQMLPRIAGVESFTKGDLVFFTLSWSFNRAYRAHPMPHQIEGLKIAERTGVSERDYMWAMLLASLVGSFASFWALLHTYYKLGTLAKAAPWTTGYGWEAFNRLHSWLTMPQERDNLCSVFTFWGFLSTIVLVFIRSRYFWWPFHPIGYAVSSSWSMNLLWLPIFIAWMVKFFVLRVAGLRGYRQTLPFFLGLILGEFTIGSLTNILGIFFNWRIYPFWGG